ncbi:hypothetical protein OIU77_029643 [Salix suchowensis]|uniref:Uncharacterized protein n=1 Tax=Salix suchowensis TaxID=1278906 RepID=A0ABQ9B991_9ROSI|nr:hypothetical protein OIU77_029643 [Salix suchowensis]
MGQIKFQREEENRESPVRVASASTMTFFCRSHIPEQSWIRYRTGDVNGGSAVPGVLQATVFRATSPSPFFSIRPGVGSDLRSPSILGS